MHKALLVLLLTSLSFPAFAQFGNVIHRVEPPLGPVAGGTRVVITGDFRLEPITSPPCMGVDVFIGGRVQEVIAFTTERVEVTTQPYTAGRFDVTVDRCGIKAVLDNAFTYGANVWERALLPVVNRNDVPGAFGSLWRTEIGAMSLAGSQRVTGEPHVACNPVGSCPDFVSGAFVPKFPAGVTGPGRLLYVEGPEPERLHVTLRVRDVSRAQESLGTELPVVWEDQTYHPRSSFAIPDIPRGPNYRSKLRLYRIDTDDPATVTVRISNELNAVITEQTVTLSGGHQEGDYLLDPPYAELDLEPIFGAEGRRNVVIQTPNEGLYWGFVSVTNNLTQQITTVTP